MSYDTEKKKGSYVEGTILLIASLYASVAILMHCLVQKEKRGGNK